MQGFDFQPRTRLVFAPGSLDRLGDLVREQGGSRVLLVSDAGLAAAGHVDRAARILAAACLEVTLFTDVHENPTTDDVDACAAVARAANVDLIVGLGGGSSMDTAKGTNFILTNGGRMQDYWGVGKATRPMLPLIAVPTTAGTGSECQSYALIADAQTHAKMACGDPKAAARVALLDPELTVSQPRAVTAHTGIDALTHAVESAVCLRANPLSRLFSFEAFRLVVGNLERVLARPEELPARSAMQLGAAYAGMAIENSMLGAAHSAANPLTAHFGVVHGDAVGLMLPCVIRYNAAEPAAARVYAELVRVGELGASGEATRPGGNAEDRDAAALLADRCRALCRAAGVPGSAAEAGVDPAAIPLLAEEAARQWTAGFNPRPIGVRGFVRLYEEALGARAACAAAGQV